MNESQEFVNWRRDQYAAAWSQFREPVEIEPEEEPRRCRCCGEWKIIKPTTHTCNQCHEEL